MMKESKHTPGKWQVNRIDSYSPDVQKYAVTSEHGLHVADVTSYGARNGQVLANAALIASAPDLLKQRDALVEENKHFRSLIERSLYALQNGNCVPSLRVELSSALAHDMCATLAQVESEGV